MASCGTSTAGLVFGGELPSPFSAENESWNGSSWTELADLNTARQRPGGAGLQTAALCFGGDKDPATTYSDETELWNGSSWTEVNDMNTARHGMGSMGTSTKAMGCSGYTGSVVGNTEQWNGTSWTEVNDVNESRTIGAGAGKSTTSAGLFFGGWGPGDIDKTEEFNSIFTVSTE